MVAINLLAACLLDRLLGDPHWRLHPVRAMGNLISWCDEVGRKLVTSSVGKRGVGVFIALLVPSMSMAVGWWGLTLAEAFHPWLAHVLWVFLAYTTLAAKDLADHAWDVYRHLQAVALPEARKALSLIVGRDTNQLSESDISRATVETVAENTSDGVIAPLWYLIIGGPPLALAYKAINTLDSMIGHLEEPYRDIGWASAKLDDVVNWIPARLSALLLITVAFVRFGTLRSVWKVYRRDRFKHASPNSGHPEAAMAGALRVQLGGPSTYHGVVVDRPSIGQGGTIPQPHHISLAIELMWMTFGAAILMGVLGMVLWNSQ